MADDRGALVLRSDSELALAPDPGGPLAGMLSDALAAVENSPARDAARAKLAILIADPDGPTAKYLEELLAPSFTVTAVDDGFDALDRIHVAHFDVIILSTEVRGIDAAVLLREIQPEMLERVILVSNSTGNPVLLPADLPRHLPVLRKPVRLDQWDNAILEVLRRTKGARYRSVESVLAL
jgi:CheY-like chemotaxis protein